MCSARQPPLFTLARLRLFCPAPDALRALPPRFAHVTPAPVENHRSMATNTAYGRFMRTNPSVEAQRQAAAHLSNAQGLPAEQKDRVKALVADGKLAEIGRDILRTEWRNSPQPDVSTASQGDDDDDLAKALAMSMGTVAYMFFGPVGTSWSIWVGQLLMALGCLPVDRRRKLSVSFFREIS